MQLQMRARRQAGRRGDEGRLQSQSGRAFTWHGAELPKPTNHESDSGIMVYTNLVMMDIVSRCLALHLDGCRLARIGAESPCADADAVMGAYLSPRLREPLLLAVWSVWSSGTSSNSTCIIGHTYMCHVLLEQQLEPHSSLQLSCPSRLVTTSPPPSRRILRL